VVYRTFISKAHSDVLPEKLPINCCHKRFMKYRITQVHMHIHQKHTISTESLKESEMDRVGWLVGV